MWSEKRMDRQHADRAVGAPWRMRSRAWVINYKRTACFWGVYYREEALWGRSTRSEGVVAYRSDRRK